MFCPSTKFCRHPDNTLVFISEVMQYVSATRYVKQQVQYAFSPLLRSEKTYSKIMRKLQIIYKITFLFQYYFKYQKYYERFNIVKVLTRSQNF